MIIMDLQLTLCHPFSLKLFEAPFLFQDAQQSPYFFYRQLMTEPEIMFKTFYYLPKIQN